MLPQGILDYGEENPAAEEERMSRLLFLPVLQPDPLQHLPAEGRREAEGEKTEDQDPQTALPSLLTPKQTHIPRTSLKSENGCCFA
jgi:hypothetical protein